MRLRTAAHQLSVGASFSNIDTIMSSVPVITWRSTGSWRDEFGLYNSEDGHKTMVSVLQINMVGEGELISIVFVIIDQIGRFLTIGKPFWMTGSVLARRATGKILAYW